MKRLIAICVPVLILLCISAAHAGSYRFYEGNGGQQSLVCSINAGSLGSYNFQNYSSCTNDEARSVVLYDLSAGDKLWVYDDPGCGTGDDYTVIEALADIGSVTISSFEGGSYTSSVSFQHVHYNGLDGKVSCVKVCNDAGCSSGGSGSGGTGEPGNCDPETALETCP